MFNGKSALITAGTGSFGKAFFRTVRQGPCDLGFTIHLAFARRSAGNFHTNVPGNVCGFSLSDFIEKGGNQRAGFFCTLLLSRKLEYGTLNN